MSAVLGADIPRPDSEHAAVILGNEFPAQSESAWERYAGQLAAAATQLRGQQPVQDEIVSAVAAQSGQWADATLTVVLQRRDSLSHRIDFYALAAGCAGRVATALWATKLHMAESVSAAEAAISAARAEIEPQISAALAVGDGPQASVLMQLLADRIQTAITAAQDEVAAESAAGTAAVGDEQRRLAAAPAAGLPAATEPAAAHHPTLGNTPAATAHQPAPAAPAVELAGHHATLGDTPAAAAHQPAPTPTTTETGQGQSDPATDPTRTAGADPRPAPGDAPSAASPPPAPQAAPPQLPSAPHLSPPAPPSNPTSAGAGSSPSLTGGSATSAGNPATAPTAASSTAPQSTAPASGGRIPPAAPAVPLVGGAAVPAAAAPSASAAGPVRASTLGPVPSTSPGTLTPATSSPAATGAASTAAAATSTASAPAVMGSPAALGTGGLGAAVPPAAAVTTPPAAATAAAAPAAGPINSAVPLGVPLLSGSSAAGGLDRTGEDLAQATDAATAILTACVAQARLRGWGGQDFGWGVAIMRAPTGLLTAWLATSYGPSYIPRGVRLPEGVRLVEPPAAVGGDVLTLLVDQMAARSAAEPGARTLVVAATAPVGRVQDWAAKLGARAVSVDERTVTPAPAGPGGQHRCEAAMPWDWRQANGFRPDQRRNVAVHRAAAALAPVTLPACTRVVEAIQRGHTLPESAWAEAEAEQATARVAYNMAAAAGGAPGAAPLAHVFRVLAASDAALSLRDTTTEGLADVLYAARLAGAPLPSDEAADR